jgi:LacI family gluconate utilization system Gnt-I transcriptional repressor
VIELWDLNGANDDGFAQVGVDHEEVGRAMAQHLLDRGHRDLAYVDSGMAEDFGAAARGAGFVAAAQAAGARAERLRAEEGDTDHAGRRALAMLVERYPQTSAVAFASDALARSALLEARSRGIEVPQRLALLGFGDRAAELALSSVALPRYEVGREAAQTLAAALHGGEASHRAVPWQLVARGST